MKSQPEFGALAQIAHARRRVKNNFPVAMCHVRQRATKSQQHLLIEA